MSRPVKLSFSLLDVVQERPVEEAIEAQDFSEKKRFSA